MSLLDIHRTHDLAESISLDLTLGDLLDEPGLHELRSMPIAYGTSRGGEALRGLVGADLGVEASEVLITQGSALALFLIALERCRGPEDEAVIVRPTFPPTLDAVRATGARVIEHTLRFADGYRLNLGSLERSLSPRTRLVSLATPQNPSGVRIRADQLSELVRLMDRACPGAVLVVDETYREATFDGNVPPSFAPEGGRVVVTGSISKAHGAPGLRIGWLATKDRELMERMRRAKMNTVICTPGLDEHLACVVLRRAPQILGARSKILAEAMGELEAWHRDHAALVDWVRPEGGALCCFRLREGAYDDAGVERFFKAQEAYDVRVAAGTWFGDEPRVLRLGFGYMPGERLGRALDALGAALRSALVPT